MTSIPLTSHVRVEVYVPSADPTACWDVYSSNMLHQAFVDERNAEYQYYADQGDSYANVVGNDDWRVTDLQSGATYSFSG